MQHDLQADGGCLGQTKRRWARLGDDRRFIECWSSCTVSSGLEGNLSYAVMITAIEKPSDFLIVNDSLKIIGTSKNLDHRLVGIETMLSKSLNDISSKLSSLCERHILY